jgi:sarcosine oxidase subunit delta
VLLIPCPWCGERSETEFRCGGEARPLRPDPTQCSDEEWIEYLCHSNNVRGLLDEIWCHEKGCGEWFQLSRDTATHAIEMKAGK